ncbi:trypsin-like peptidase domain-containing protein [Sphaerospermopsis torques-reginae]|uniref:Trypsin-like peptidase domain-containing protein n=1 Tax=Sphaerospermopsis torques-reginae ITEP-024 TaxID=984208 RepID=A0ABX8WWJ1_9CYAN|nr:trypsin-like peptidase domain-containing protein [Sphaerospermopsis torques-reginae]QYX30792.1 trypsin-like peptidase domain-containing protein [Sphaerospermopsis torques-reginae ITEP-024]
MILNRVYQLTATVMTAVIIVVQTPSATALQQSEINTIAKKITVRIEGNTQEFGKTYGSGIIIKKQGNQYTVLTNWHVVQVPGNYNLYTNDNQKYAINNKKKLGELDLAIVEFNSSLNYSPATIGNSRQLTETTPVYAAGFAAPDAICLEACYRFVEGKINSVLDKYKDGYGLIYSNIIAPGMSGGPVLNQDGFLVGINGLGSGFTTPDKDTTSFGVIPIHEYQKFDNVGSQAIQKPTEKPTEITTKPTSSINFTLAKTLPGDFFPVTAIALSPNGEILASGSNNGSIQLWNIATGSKIHTLQGHSDRIESIAFSPDGKTLASGSNDETIKLWHIATGTENISFQGSFFSVYSVTFSPNGKILASGSSDGTIKLWDVSTTNEILTLSGHTTKVSAVAFSPDGKILASGSSDNTIKLWNIDTGTEIRTLTGHSNRVNSVAFSLKERILASGSDDNTIKLWNIDTGTEIRTLTGHSNRVGSVAFSPHGRILASGSDDNTIKLWNVATGTQIHSLTGYADTVDSVIFSSDGKTLASASRESNIKVWRVSE